MKSGQLKSSDKECFHLPLGVYLAYLLVCTFLLPESSFAGYVSSGNGSDEAKAATGFVVLTHKGDTSLEINQPPEGGLATQSFAFEVSNAGSQVAISYAVAVTLDHGLPAGISMTLDGKQGAENGSNTYVFSDMGTLQAGQVNTAAHVLSFSGDYQTIREQSQREITISVQAEQMD